jgi:hypothetical protein
MYNTDLPTRAALPTSGQLLRSTVMAALIAAALLATTVLPAEYGIDPTRIGRLLGLTQMGEIKAALAEEVRQEEALAQAVDTQAGATPSAVAPALPDARPAASAEPAASSGAVQPKQDVVTIRLKPGQGAEVKLAMRKDAKVRYEWSSAGGRVNYDTHGDPVGAPKGFYHGYGTGRNEAADAGTLQAAFDGTHGWFWRNRSGAEVTVTLKTSGDYQTIKRVL